VQIIGEGLHRRQSLRYQINASKMGRENDFQSLRKFVIGHLSDNELTLINLFGMIQQGFDLFHTRITLR
jgi:hypothetical protein